MESILKLFHSILSYTSMIAMLFPVIAAIKARKQGAVFQFDMKLFAIYAYLAAIIQYTVLAFAWTGYFFRQYWEYSYQYKSYLFIFILLLQLTTFLFLLLKWAGLKKYFIPLLILVSPIMVLANHYTNSYYPDLMTWAEVSILLFTSFTLSYKMDKLLIHLPREHNFIHLGIYLYCLLTLIGITPNSGEIRMFGHILHSIALILTNYYFYRSFKCLYP